MTELESAEKEYDAAREEFELGFVGRYRVDQAARKLMLARAKEQQ